MKRLPWICAVIVAVAALMALQPQAQASRRRAKPSLAGIESAAPAPFVTAPEAMPPANECVDAPVDVELDDEGEVDGRMETLNAMAWELQTGLQAARDGDWERCRRTWALFLTVC